VDLHRGADDDSHQVLTNFGSSREDLRDLPQQVIDTRRPALSVRRERHVREDREARLRPGGSAIDARTTRHPGYAMSQSARPRIERVFAWLKTIAGLRKVKLRGVANVDALFVFASAAFNIRRIMTLRAQAQAA
jgi:hypothetical protein